MLQFLPLLALNANENRETRPVSTIPLRLLYIPLFISSDCIFAFSMVFLLQDVHSREVQEGDCLVSLPSVISYRDLTRTTASRA